MNATVARLRRYPVKSMLGEDIFASEVTERGLAGDRAFGIIDAETGKLASAKRPRRWGDLLRFSAAYDGAVDDPPPAARITFPDGSVRSTDEPDVDEALGRVLGRSVRLTRAYEQGLVYMEEDWHGELKDDAKPYGPEIGVVEGERMIDVPASLGVPGGFFDATAVHLVTTSTLRALSDAKPGSRFAAERFRPNLVIDVPGEAGFVENEWSDRVLEIGDVHLEIIMRVPRCVVTTLPQGDLPHDGEVLRTVTRENKVSALGGEYPCVGVYASVTQAGTITVGDPVALR